MNISGNDGGINEPLLDNVILELGANIDSISTLFQEIEMLIYDTNDIFKGDTADALRNKFNSYQKQFEIVKNNLTGYQNDLIKVKSLHKEVDKNTANMIRDFTDTVDKKAKEIEK